MNYFIDPVYIDKQNIARAARYIYEDEVINNNNNIQLKLLPKEKICSTCPTKEYKGISYI